MIEILWKDIVHYRRPDNHPDVIEVEAMIAKGNTLYSIRRIEDEI